MLSSNNEQRDEEMEALKARNKELEGALRDLQAKIHTGDLHPLLNCDPMISNPEAGLAPESPYNSPELPSLARSHSLRPTDTTEDASASMIDAFGA